MTDYSKITALYSRLSVGDEDRDGGESNSIQNQKIFLENYARGQHLTNIRHYIDDDESGRFFDRSAYSRMMDDVENGKIGVCIMKDLTRWGRDYLQVGNAMEIFRRNNVRFIAVNNGIDSEKPDTLEFAPFINIMSEWYAKDISKKVKTGMLTNEIVLKVFSDYLNRDTDFEVVLTSRGYTVMGFDNHRQDWNTVDFCPTPEALRDSLLNAYESFRELEITGGDRDLTEKEEAKLAKERDALTALCEKEAAKCSS